MVRFLQAITEGFDMAKTMQRFPPEAVVKRVADSATDTNFVVDMAYEIGNATRDRYPNYFGRTGEGERLPAPHTLHNLPPQWVFESVFEWVQDADPTNKKAYALSIFNIWMNDLLFHLEDLGRVTDGLEKIVQWKVDGTLRRLNASGLHEQALRMSHPITIEAVNFLVRTDGKISPAVVRLPNFENMVMVIEACINDDPELRLSRDAQAEVAEKELTEAGEAIILYNTPEWKAVALRTEDASKFYGRNTRWCTASRSGNMFNNYAKTGQLVVFINKPKNLRWQLHAPHDDISIAGSYYKQADFRDDKDQTADPSVIPFDVWKSMSAIMNHMHVRTCYEEAEENYDGIQEYLDTEDDQEEEY